MSLSRFVILIGIVLLAGCSTLFPPNCERFDAQSKKTNYATAYRLKNEETGSLSKKDLAKAPSYQITLDTEKARPCSHVGIKKELVLLRSASKDLIFEETREFFAGNGTRIVAKNETLTEQFNKSGRYETTVLLPIPQNAPAGKYRIVSTLSVRTRNGPTTVLGKSSASFEVVATK